MATLQTAHILKMNFPKIVDIAPYTRKRRGDDVKKSGQPGAPEFSFARSNWRLIVNGNNACAGSRGVSAPSGLVMFSTSEGGQI